MKQPLVKICGLVCQKDVEAVNLYKSDYVGFVLFFPKSKRNLEIADAKELMNNLNPEIKKVAVTVSPTKEQVIEICAVGFDYIQIHGELSKDVLEICSIPIIKAFNVSDLNNFDYFSQIDKISGFVFDASAPGSGKTFDWDILDNLPRSDKLFILSGGLNASNVLEGISKVKPDIVDVSSGVEYSDKPGKNPDKIKEFIDTVRGNWLIIRMNFCCKVFVFIFLWNIDSSVNFDFSAISYAA